MASLIVVFGGRTYAAPAAGVLRGLTATNGVTALTDGNDSTYVGGSGLLATYNLGGKYNIDGYYSTHGNHYIDLYDVSGNLLQRITVPYSGSVATNYVTIPTVNDVVKVVITAFNYNNYYEVDLHGTLHDTTPPAPPTGLAVNSVGDVTVNLVWSPNTEPDLDHYEIYQDNVKIGTTTNTSYSVTGLTNGQTYSFKITAVDHSSNVSGFSSVVNGTPYPPLVKPTVTSATTPYTLSLSWNYVGVSYEVWQKSGTLFNKVSTQTGNSFSLSNLTPNTDYIFYVVSHDQYGRVSQSDNVTAHTQALPPPVKPVVTYTSTVTNVTLSWTSVGVSYEVWNVYNGQNFKLNSTNSTTYTITNLPLNSTSQYYVVAFDQYGQSSQSDTISATLQTPPPVITPTLSSSNVGINSVDLKWTDASASYELFQDGTSIKTLSTLSFSVTSLLPSHTYQFYVKATDQYGRVSTSNTVSVTTLTPPPPRSLILQQAGITTTTANVMWNDIQATSYDVYLNDVKVQTVSNIGAGFRGLSPGTNYSVKVTGLDPYGRMITSNVLSFTTVVQSPILPPSNPTPPPKVSNSNNPDLNQASDQLAQGVNDWKKDALTIIAVIILVIIFVFGTWWFLRLVKKRYMKARNIVYDRLSSGSVSRKIDGKTAALDHLKRLDMKTGYQKNSQLQRRPKYYVEKNVRNGKRKH